MRFLGSHIVATAEIFRIPSVFLLSSLSQLLTLKSSSFSQVTNRKVGSK
jgi:hypothetical protein